jgi:hypothetical protein
MTTEIIDKPPVKDILGTLLSPGDIIYYVPTSGSSDLRPGVYLNHFDNGNGWKMRVRDAYNNPAYSYGVNAYISTDGIAYGVLRMSESHIEVNKENISISRVLQLKALMEKEGKIKPLGDSEEVSDKSKINKDGLRILEAVSKLGLPDSIKKQVQNGIG